MQKTPPNKRQITLTEVGRKTIAEMNGKKAEFKTAFLKSLKYGDAINYIEDKLKHLI